MLLYRYAVALLLVLGGAAAVVASEQAAARRTGRMMKNGVEVACSGDPYCDAQPFIECCPQGPDAWRRLRRSSPQLVSSAQRRAQPKDQEHAQPDRPRAWSPRRKGAAKIEN